MPYKSAKQRAFIHIRHPNIAARWDKEYGGKIAHDRARSKKRKGKRGFDRFGI